MSLSDIPIPLLMKMFITKTPAEVLFILGVDILKEFMMTPGYTLAGEFCYT